MPCEWYWSPGRPIPLTGTGSVRRTCPAYLGCGRDDAGYEEPGDAAELLGGFLELPGRDRLCDDPAAGAQPGEAVLSVDRAEHEGRVEGSLVVEGDDRGAVEAAWLGLVLPDVRQRRLLRDTRGRHAGEDGGEGVPRAPPGGQPSGDPRGQVLHRAALPDVHELTD